jgi:hypothetical protein
MSPEELRAADLERVSEAPLDAEKYYWLIVEADREDALELIRDLLRLVAWQEVFAARLRRASSALEALT